MSSALITQGDRIDPAGLLVHGGQRFPKKLDEKLPPNLSPAVRSAALAALDPRQAVGKQEPELLQVTLVGWLSGALFALNHSNSYADKPGDPEGLSIEILAGLVAKMVQRNFPNFRPAEVAEAINRGSSGDWFDPRQGYLVLSVPTVKGWLGNYQHEARRPALELLEKTANDLGDGPREMNLPDWHPVTFLLTASQLCGLVNKRLDGRALDDFDFDVLAYDWLERLGILARFCPVADRQAILDAEIAKLSDPLLAVADLSKNRRGELYSFRLALLAQTMPTQHPVLSEAKGNARRKLLFSWLATWESARDCYYALLDVWASAYFSHYQTLNNATD